MNILENSFLFNKLKKNLMPIFSKNKLKTLFKHKKNLKKIKSEVFYTLKFKGKRYRIYFSLIILL